MGTCLRVLFTLGVLARPGKDVSSGGCSSKQKASRGASVGLGCPLPALGCSQTAAEAGGCMCPLQLPQLCSGTAKAGLLVAQGWLPPFCIQQRGRGRGRPRRRAAQARRSLPPPLGLCSGNISEWERQGTSVLSSFGCCFTQEHNRVARRHQVLGQDADSRDSTVQKAACLQECGYEAAPLHI